MQSFYNSYNQGGYSMPQMQMQTQQQMQNGGFMPAPNETYAINYPIAPGNSITFKIEGKPIVIEKSMGFSQLESPKVDRYRLVKENIVEASEIAQKPSENTETINNTINSLKNEIGALWKEIEGIKNDYVKSDPTLTKTTVRDKDGDD